MSDDPCHAQVCKLNRREINRRHNAISDCLQKIARQCNAAVQKEPTDLRLPEDMPEGSRVHPDILIKKADQQFLVDVTVVHSCARSYSHRNSDTKAAGSMHSALNQREQKKHKRYDDWADCNNSKFIAFVMDSHGSLSREALKLVLFLANQLVDRDEYSSLHEAREYILDRLSMALQGGNGRMNEEIKQQAIDQQERESRVRSHRRPSPPSEASGPSDGPELEIDAVGDALSNLNFFPAVEVPSDGEVGQVRPPKARSVYRSDGRLTVRFG
jgi:hypothetical protein